MAVYWFNPPPLPPVALITSFSLFTSAFIEIPLPAIIGTRISVPTAVCWFVPYATTPLPNTTRPSVTSYVIDCTGCCNVISDIESMPTPASPFGPCGPVSPFGPCGPVSPFGPCRPVAPVAPVSPFGPCGPVSPFGPCRPVAPVAPVAPVSPFGPCGPGSP